MSSAGAITQTTWRFVRGPESVRLDLQQDARRVTTGRLGLWTCSASHECEDDSAAMSLAEQYQGTLTGNGFVLQARPIAAGGRERLARYAD
jgi:hypothetical protein